MEATRFHPPLPKALSGQFSDLGLRLVLSGSQLRPPRDEDKSLGKSSALPVTSIRPPRPRVCLSYIPAFLHPQGQHHKQGQVTRHLSTRLQFLFFVNRLYGLPIHSRRDGLNLKHIPARHLWIPITLTSTQKTLVEHDVS